jgi:hypothetical protein
MLFSYTISGVDERGQNFKFYFNTRDQAEVYVAAHPHRQCEIGRVEVKPCHFASGQCRSDGGCVAYNSYASRRISRERFKQRVTDCPYRQGYRQGKLITPGGDQ